MQITVYSKPDCTKCTATYRALDKIGAEYEVVDITEDADARDYVMGLGHMAAPVVVVSGGPQGSQHWSDFRADRIKALATVTAQAVA